MDLENKYRAAQEADEATVSNIRRACAAFMKRHPDYVPTKENEQILFAAMSAPENDHLSPTSLASWEDVYAQVGERLEQKTATSQQRRTTSVEYLRRYEGDPGFAEQVNALGPR